MPHSLRGEIFSALLVSAGVNKNACGKGALLTSFSRFSTELFKSVISFPILL